MALKEITFDIRSKPAGRVIGVMKDKEENLNRFNYSKTFEIDAPGSTNFDVYYMELDVPQDFLGIEGKLHILLDGSKFYEQDISKLAAGKNVLDIDRVITKGHSLSAVVEHTNAKSLGHYVLQLKLETR